MITTSSLQITPEMLSLVSEIHEFKGAWRALGTLAPERLSALRRVATIESVGSSTRIEGSRLSDREVERLISNIDIKAFGSRDEQEVAGYADVMETLFASWPDIAVTENHVKQLHRDLLRYSSKDEFWYWFTQGLKRLLVRDQYLPALIYHQPPKPKGKRKRPPFELYVSWQWASDQYEKLIADACDRMPGACACAPGGLMEGKGLLRHCAEVLLDRIVRQTPLPAVFAKKIDSSFLTACVDPQIRPWKSAERAMEGYRQWQQWRRRIVGPEQDVAFTLGFRLVEPPDGGEEDWSLHFVAVPKDDPSQRLALSDYWSSSRGEREQMRRQLGKDFETHLLLNLGLAARMVPMLWAGLDTAEPRTVALDLDEAFDFLKESAWVLEDAGFKIIVPSWWTPQGRRRLKIRLRSSLSKSASGATTGSGHVNLENLIQYSYQLAIGDQVVSAEEWQRLVEAKSPLVQFRGQWVELDRDKMQEMLALWREHGGGAVQEGAEMSIQELLQRTATDDAFEVDRDDALAAMLDKLRDRSRLEPIANLPQLNASLRDYQKRGVAWLRFLEQLGLNGCLADDMGLGKTTQVIAHLVQEREDADDLAPTLLVAPTSVLGNWHKEIEKFAPHLKTLVHHGPGRERDVERQLEEKEGIERQGLMLSTLMKLKQICNHPAQFLQDGSAFTAERSHKLERLPEMLEEVMAEGDSVLIFSQFTEIGSQREKLLKQGPGYNTYYLHGGTSRGRREAMIEAFQDPQTEPSIFVMSLKAGAIAGNDESWLTRLDNDRFKELIRLNREAVMA